MKNIYRYLKNELREKFISIYPELKPDKKGYIKSIYDNILPGIDFEPIENDLKKGSGSELKSKFKAIHSSSALGVNNFGLWKVNPEKLKIFDINGFEELYFEYKCPTGLSGTPPNLDVLLKNKNDVVGIESKFLEITKKKKQEFSKSYTKEKLNYAENFIFKIMEKYRDKSIYLGVSQLIKHYFGLMRSFPDHKKTLLYLYWIPKCKNGSKTYIIEHEKELEKFHNDFNSKYVSFISMSYLSFWDKNKDKYKKHINKILERYLISI